MNVSTEDETPEYLLTRLRQVVDRQADTSVSRALPLDVRANKVLADLALGGRVFLDAPATVRRAITLIEGEEAA